MKFPFVGWWEKDKKTSPNPEQSQIAIRANCTKYWKELGAKHQIGPASTRDLNTDFHGFKGLIGFFLKRLQT
ncbi:MAG: hypothetical protein ACI4UF_02870, partial [Thermoguttaceae bacterium]